MTWLVGLGLGLVLALLSTSIFSLLFGDWACFRHGHSPRKLAQGGFRCLTCGMPGATLDELGQEGGYVSPGERPRIERAIVSGRLR